MLFRTEWPRPNRTFHLAQEAFELFFKGSFIVSFPACEKLRDLDFEHIRRHPSLRVNAAKRAAACAHGVRKDARRAGDACHGVKLVPRRSAEATPALEEVAALQNLAATQLGEEQVVAEVADADLRQNSDRYFLPPHDIPRLNSQGMCHRTKSEKRRKHDDDAVVDEEQM